MKFNMAFVLDRVKKLTAWFNGDYQRLWALLFPAILLAIVITIAPHKAAVMAYKLAAVLLAGFFGFRLDRRIFWYARPDKVPENQKAGAGIRRAAMIVGTMVAVALVV